MEKVAENKYKIYIRNKLDTSKELELIRPKSDPIKFYVKNFLNTKNDEFTQVVNPNTIAIIETDIEMGKYDLIRIKLPVGQAESDLDTENI